MKKHLLRSMLVMLSMLLGFSTNALADELTISPSGTTVVKGNGKTEGNEANAETNFYDAAATSWLCTQANISGGALNNQNSAYEGSRVVITKFDASTQLSGMLITKATLKFKAVCTVSGKNSNVITSSLGTDWDPATVTWNSLDKAVTQISAGTGQNVKTSEKELSEDVTDLLNNDADKVVAFAIYTYTAREQKISGIQLVVEAVDASSAANVTLNYVDGADNVLKSETVTTISGTNYTLTAEQKASFVVGDKKYFYVSDNSAEVTIASDGSSVIKVVCREANVYNYTLNSNLGVVATGSGYEGEKIAVGYPRYALAENVFYEAPKTRDSKKEYRIDVNLTEDNATADITYTAKEGVNAVFFTEAENIEGATATTTGNLPVRGSNAKGATTTDPVVITTLPNGKYKFHVGVFTSKASGFESLSVNIGIGKETYAATCTGVNMTEPASAEFELNAESTEIKFLGQTADTQFDYIWIEKTGDAELKLPIYIETDLTSQFNALTNWQNWTGATGYTATNFCPKVTTNAGQEVQVCEKYEGTCDTTGEIFYQTVTGLTAGTYKIELYGGAAYTFGRGFSSEAFSTGTWNAGDHIDENTGVILYAETSEDKYEKEIPIYYATNFPDGAATVVLEGVVIGENGQVKIGMNKTSKSTNWHVIQLKGVTAQVDAVELHTATLAAAQAALEAEANAVITGSERTALEAAITANTTPAEETAEGYKTVINALNAALTAFNNAKPAYQALADAKTYAATLTFKYAAAAKKEAAEAAAAAVATDADDATAKTTALYQALRQYAESSALAEGVEGAVNMTDKIVNPAAEEALAEPWKTVKGESSGGSINILNGQPWTDGSNNATHKYFDGGDWGANAWDVALQQEITLPAGKYQLTAKMRASGDVEQTLFAGETAKAGQSIYDTGGLFNLGWNDTSIEFEMAEEGAITIGVRGVTTVQHNWMSFSDFRLVQLEAAAQPVALANVKALKEFDSEEMDDVEATLTLTNAKVNFLTTDYVLLEDASAGLLLEGSGLGALVKEGDVLNGELAVTMKYNWGMWQAVLTNGIEGVTATAGEATPMVVTKENANAYTEDYDFRLAQFADVTINVNEGQLSFTTALLGEEPWSINDQFAVMPETITDGAIGTLTGYMASLYGMTFFTPTAFVEKAVDPQVAHATVTYALAEGDTFTSGQTVEVKNGEDVVATITYGEAGEGYADFTAAKQDSHIDGFAAFTEGNGTNGNKAGGTFYTIVPKYDGVITVGIVLNADKAFSVLEDGVAKENFNGLKATQKYYGTTAFNVTANKSYKFFCAGSKLGFYGFNYEYGEGTEAIDETDNGITTGITTVNTEVKAAEGVYNLRGQKVENMVKGQLYIINGKKVMIK